MEDVIQAVILSLTSEGCGGQAYNVGGETMMIGVLTEKISEFIEKKTGSRVGIEHLPPRPRETKEFTFNLEKIKEDLRYEPGWGVMQGVEQITEFQPRTNGTI